MNALEYFIDTNVFLRVVVKDEAEKASACERVLSAIGEGKIKAFTSHLVLAELTWTAQKFYRLSRGDIVKILQGILRIKNLRIIDKFNIALAVQYYATTPVKFIDALIASHHSLQTREALVISYDKDFDRLGIKRKEPDEIIRYLTKSL